MLPGAPSDDVEKILAAGDGGIGTLFVSMARRHPDGRDADYLRWHTLDHRPEQHRLAAVRASLRLVSTPECRAARGPCDDRFDAVDHVMTYFFADQDGLTPFNELSAALGSAGRKLPLLPPVQRGVYSVTDKVAHQRIKIGADVLPWWPAVGVYVLLEVARTPPAELSEVEGVAGMWSAASQSVDEKLAGARTGQLLTYCFLDDDPVAAAKRIRPVLESRYRQPGFEPILAAPFHPVVPHEWDRHVP